MGLDHGLNMSDGVHTDAIELACWRKINAVHGWADNRLNHGNPSQCEDLHVTIADLIDLRDRCKAILADPTQGPELLPSYQGFFFGTYEYDEWYMQGIKQVYEDVQTILDNLAEAPDQDIYYWSSW